MAASDSDNKSEAFRREVGLTQRYPSSSPTLFDLFLIGRQKRLWTSENEGLGPMGWLSITAGKSRVMSPRLNSSFISPHAQVSSSLSVLIVSIPKFDCRSLGLSQPSYSLIKYSTSRERKLHLHCELFYFQLSPLRFSCFFFGIYQHRLLLTTTVSLFILCIKTGCAKLYL